MSSQRAPAQILFTESRDFLLSKEGVVVKADVIAGNVVGIIMAPPWLPATFEHTISLIDEPYKELRNRAFTFVYVAVERDEQYIDTMRLYGEANKVDYRPDAESFADVVRKLPDGCLVVPFEDVETRIKIVETHNAGMSLLALFGPDGCLHTEQGLALLEKWGAAGYPFDSNRIMELRKARGKTQTLEGLLVHEGRDELISSEGGKRVKVEELKEKMVALCFGAKRNIAFKQFTPVLVSIYRELKAREKDFELVFISSDESLESFKEHFARMPWLAIPFENEKTRNHLNSWFEVKAFPTLIILDKQGKTLTMEGVEIFCRYGWEAYPFSVERLEMLKLAEEAKRASQTLEMLLVSDKRDFVLSKNGPVKVATLVGKTVGLYFSAHWCPPCQKFTPKLKSIYNELKGRGEEFEVIFVSGDRDEESFNEYYGSMPWLALPFDDKAISDLPDYFEIESIPQLIIIGPNGKTVTTDGRGLVALFGADAFPFTEDRVVEVKAAIKRKYQDFAKEVTCGKHDHTLTLVETTSRRQVYICDDCGEQGFAWVYICAECGYDFHPECIREEENKAEEIGHASEREGANVGYVCEGDACRKL